MIFKHLLPKAKAWSITVDKQLRQFFEGLQVALVDAIQTYYDQIWADMDPQKTRELELFENQFALPNTLLTEQERRDRLDATWKALGGQSPRYIQDTLQAAGFDVYVHEWWVPGTEPAVNVKACVAPRNPFDYLTDGSAPLTYKYVDGAADMQDGDLCAVNNWYYGDSDASPQSVFLKPDGTKMYIGDDNGVILYQYTLPLPGEITTDPIYDGVSIDLTSEINNIRDVFFKPDGTKFYAIDDLTNTIYQYSLPTAWVLTGATYDTVSFDFSTQDTLPYCVQFKDDGTKMYMSGLSTSTIYQYSLPTAWVLTGATYDTILFDFSTQDTWPGGMQFKSDGTKVYIAGGINETIYQYSLPTAWVLTGATYDTILFDLSAVTSTPVALHIRDDGLEIFIAAREDGGTDSYIYQFTTSTAWTLSDAVLAAICAQDGATLGQPTGYPLVNVVFIYRPGFIGDNSADMQDGGLSAMDGAFATGSEYQKRGYVIPIDPLKYPYFLYIGGSAFPLHATIPTSRRTEFETLCLKICPAQLWLGILVDYS